MMVNEKKKTKWEGDIERDRKKMKNGSQFILMSLSALKL